MKPKTQINELTTGLKNQIRNPDIDYSKLNYVASSGQHAGSNYDIVLENWKKIVKENPEEINAIIKGVSLKLKAKYSLSKESVSYTGTISDEEVKKIFHLTRSKKGQAYISIHFSNVIEVGNGGKSFVYLCPSYVTILQ
jgi:uncharacterized protein YajQ (UPF0234 family)